MHNAPPVVFPVGRFVWGPRLALLLAAVAASVLAVWLVWAEVSAFRLGWTACIWLAAAWCSAWWVRHEFLQEGELAWDGEAWWFCGHGGARHAVNVQLQWDAGRAMLLRVSATPRHGWLDRYTWLQASRLPLQWHGLRCAVHATHTI